MAFARSLQEEILMQQSESRRRYEIEKALMEGKQVAIPSPLNSARMINDGEIPTTIPMNDELMYDHNTRSYKTRFQQMEIDALNKKIQDKEKEEASKQIEEKMKLENLIAYYYNR